MLNCKIYFQNLCIFFFEKHGENKTLPPRIMQQYNKVRTIGKEYKNLQDLIEKSEEGSDEAHKEIEKFLVYYRKYTKPMYRYISTYFGYVYLCESAFELHYSGLQEDVK